MVRVSELAAGALSISRFWAPTAEVALRAPALTTIAETNRGGELRLCIQTEAVKDSREFTVAGVNKSTVKAGEIKVGNIGRRDWPVVVVVIVEDCIVCHPGSVVQGGQACLKWTNVGRESSREHRKEHWFGIF